MIKFNGNAAGLDDFDDDKFNHHDNDSGDCDFELDARQFHGNARGPYDVDDETMIMMMHLIPETVMVML